MIAATELQFHNYSFPAAFRRSPIDGKIFLNDFLQLACRNLELRFKADALRIMLQCCNLEPGEIISRRVFTPGHNLPSNNAMFTLRGKLCPKNIAAFGTEIIFAKNRAGKNIFWRQDQKNFQAKNLRGEKEQF